MKKKISRNNLNLRVAIENIHPQVDDGRFPIKRIIGESVKVAAQIHADGHDAITARLKYRMAKQTKWTEVPMTLTNSGLDIWESEFPIKKPGYYQYTIEAWANYDRTQTTTYDPVLEVMAETEKALYSAWYEMFPRSAGPDPKRSATFAEAALRLKDIAHMGFDVLYLPPIHPIGKSFRKGPNNALQAKPGDPGSPWGIGSEEGGHKSIHPDLGTLEDFQHFVKQAQKHNLDIALDIALQCSPDHPYVTEHPEWFFHRPDGTIQYAENPPKKYQDIYPLHFSCEHWQSLWEEMKDIFLFWIKNGVKIFRVDNPHTKPYRFWAWLIREIKKQHPDTLFLSESFTRPPKLTYLAKCGFSQSYTYFTWKNTKDELLEFSKEWIQSHVSEFLRPNLFANTPDILHEYLQKGGRPAFMVRLALAATLSSAYGIYGPVFELCENKAFPGKEENMDSEKYQIRHWDHNRPGHIRDFIKCINQARQDNPALHANDNLQFFDIDNDQMIAYGKMTSDKSNIVLMMINLDYKNVHTGWVKIPYAALGLEEGSEYVIQDLIDGTTYTWQNESNFIRLDPKECPVHVFKAIGKEHRA